MMQLETAVERQCHSRMCRAFFTERAWFGLCPSCAYVGRRALRLGVAAGGFAGTLFVELLIELLARWLRGL